MLAIIVIIALFVIGLIVVTIRFVSDLNKDPESGTGNITPSTASTASYNNLYNAVNGGYVAQNSEYVYYIDESGNIVRMDSNWANRTVIVSDMACSQLYLLDETLFFLSQNDNGIYAADLSGGGARRIVYDNTYWFNIAGECIYYINGFYEWDMETWTRQTYGDLCLYRTDLGGNGRTQITHCATENPNLMESGLVYYNADDNSINVSNLDGSSSRCLYVGSEDEYCGEFIVYDDLIYYTVTDYDDESKSGMTITIALLFMVPVTI